MSNLFRRASDAFRHHQHHLRKDSEDSVNQETVESPSQEPQERVDQLEPQAPLVSPSPQEQKVETAAGLKSEGNAEAKAGLWSLFLSQSCSRIGAKSLTNVEKETPHHHHHWGFFRRPGEGERDKRRSSHQEKERADWDASKKSDQARGSSEGAGVDSQGG